MLSSFYEARASGQNCVFLGIFKKLFPALYILYCLPPLRTYHQRFYNDSFSQCCGAGADGAEIILGPGARAEAETNFNKHFLQSVLRMLG